MDSRLSSCLFTSAKVRITVHIELKWGTEALLRYRNRAEIIVLMCGQEPYLVWFSCRSKSCLDKYERSLRFEAFIHLSIVYYLLWSKIKLLVVIQGILTQSSFLLIPFLCSFLMFTLLSKSNKERQSTLHLLFSSTSFINNIEIYKAL